MKYVTYGQRSVMLGDDAAHALLGYATALASAGRADHVTVRTVGLDGEEDDVTLLLSRGLPLMIEPASLSTGEPDNDSLIAELRQRTARLRADHAGSRSPIPHGLSDY